MASIRKIWDTEKTNGGTKLIYGSWKWVLGNVGNSRSGKKSGNQMEIAWGGGELITSLDLPMAPDLLLHAQKSWKFLPGMCSV